MNKDTHYLPPDNFQQRPFIGFADRTSATNIGFGALAPLCAAYMRLMSPSAALKLLDNTLLTIESLEKWNGNLYNWYKISDLSPMEPKYISSVDSGNFLCCLLAGIQLPYLLRQQGAQGVGGPAQAFQPFGLFYLPHGVGISSFLPRCAGLWQKDTTVCRTPTGCTFSGPNSIFDLQKSMRYNKVVF